MLKTNKGFNFYFSIACWVALIAYLVLYVVRIIPWIATELPNDMHEYSTVNVVYKILEGVNPYQLETFIDSAYVYGITMPALGAFLYSIIGFGINLTVFLRLMSLFFILASAYLVAKEIYSVNKDKFAVVLGFTLTLVIGWWTAPIIVTTNTMGVFLMLLTYFILRRYQSVWSVILIALLTILSFYTKPYFLFVFGIVSIWYFLTSYKNLIVYISTFGIVGFVSVVLINHYFPLYFYITIFTHQAISGFGWDYTLKEWASFLLFYFPLFIISLVASIQYIKSNKINLLGRYKIDDELFYLIYMVCASIVLIKLGGHWGAHLTYFYHLLLPIITIYGLKHLNVIKHKFLKPILYFSLMLFSVYHIFFVSSLPQFRTAEAESALKKIDNTMSAYNEKDILILTQYAGPYGRKNNYKTYYSSHNWQFSLSKNQTINQNPRIFPIHKEFIERMVQYENGLIDNVKNKKYKMIITTGGIPEVNSSDTLINKTYNLKETIQIPAGRVSWSVVQVYLIK